LPAGIALESIINKLSLCSFATHDEFAIKLIIDE
jgi:hypothetical protein